MALLGPLQREPSDEHVLRGTPYRPLRLIGSGGMGTVHEVRHTELGRHFVLKILHDRLAGRRDLAARMKNEWTALAVLSHPNIVQVTDAGHTADGLPYYVMEKLEGETVGALLKRKGKLGTREAVRIVLDVLQGLAAAHATGAVHRDIKPQNIFVVAGGPTKILDFGIAQVRDQAARVITAAGVAIGTPRYMAPEQAEGRRVDGRADIYATALVLYEMLAGKGPFAHVRDPNQLVLAHIAEEPVRLDWIESGVSAELADLVQRWLAKLPESRPFDARVAHAELAALVASFVDAEAPVDDVTHGGDYEAPTWGPDSDGVEPGTRTRVGDVLQEADVEQPRELPWPSPFPPVAPTSSVAPHVDVRPSSVASTRAPAVPAVPERAAAAKEEGRTWGWGALAQGAASEVPPERLPSLPTPPPAGWTASTPQRDPWGGPARLVAVAALASFVGAWGVVRTLDGSASGSAQPAGATRAALAVEPASLAEGPAKPAHRTPGVSSPRPEAALPVPAEPSTVGAPSAAAAPSTGPASLGAAASPTLPASGAGPSASRAQSTVSGARPGAPKLEPPDKPVADRSRAPSTDLGLPGSGL